MGEGERLRERGKRKIQRAAEVKETGRAVSAER
jgi:hypothetical protein